jgi:hypothetical protein
MYILILFVAVVIVVAYLVHDSIILMSDEAWSDV